MFAYGPIIASLRNILAFLERNALSQTKLQAADNQKSKDMEVDVRNILHQVVIPLFSVRMFCTATLQHM